MDFVRCAGIKITGKEKGRCSENIESIEANDWRNGGQGTHIRSIARHSRVNQALCRVRLPIK